MELRNFTICLILFGILILACERDNKKDCNNTFCTQEFKGIGISIKHISDSSAFILSNYKVIRVLDNQDITSTIIINTNLGFYNLVDDTEKEMLKFKNVEIEFQGFGNSSLIIQKRFIVTSDCCHVSLISGESTFYI